MESSPQPTITQPEETPAPPSSLAARLLNVFAAPGEVFDEVAAQPVNHANWLVPALLLILASWLGLWLVLSQESVRHQLSDLTDQAIQKQAQHQHWTEQRTEQTRQAAEKYASIGPIIGGLLIPLFVAGITPFFWALILWLLGNQAFNGSSSYLKWLEVAGLANMVMVLEAVVRHLLIVGTGNFYASPSLTLLVRNFDPQNMSQVALGFVNIMAFWLLAVRSVALARLGRASFLKAAFCVFGVWAAYSGFFFGIGLAMQALMKRVTG